MAGKTDRIRYEFLNASENFIFEARETGKTHTAFRYELLLFRSIQNGDLEGVKAAINSYRNLGLVIGHMSNNPIREIHYWAVSTIAIAIHYAILGGLDESEAYQLSDQYILEIDTLKSMDDCIDYLSMKAIELVMKVKEYQIPQYYNALINKCIHYIHVNLHSRLRIEDIARELHVSRDYLSQAFKKETSQTLHQYILMQKLEESQRMLSLGMSIYEISYTLCFCNESHFIQSFKKQFKLTPKEYVKHL